MRFGLGLEEAEGVRASAEGVQAEPVFRLAAREGLASFVLWGLEESGAARGIPRDLLGRLEAQAARERDHLVRVYLVAVQSLRILDEMGVPSLVVKGLAVAPFWPLPTLRYMSDVDIVVPWEDRKTIWSRYEGFRRIQKALGVTVEVEPLHHDLTAGNTIDLDFEKVFARSEVADVGGRRARVASPLDLVLATASSALRHDPRSFRLLLDLAFLVRSGRVDLGALAEEGRRLGLGRVLRFLFLSLRARLGMEADERVLAAGRESGLERALGLLDGDGGGEPGPAWFAGPGLSRAWMKIRLEHPFRFLRRSLENFFPPPLALRNQFRREGRQEDPLALLYLAHWRRRLGSLVPRR